MEMDMKEIAARADAETVADYIGLDITRKGNRSYIRCPGHKKRLGRPDMNIGNCVLRDNGYFCFACNTFVPTHEMVAEATGCDDRRAWQIMAEAAGADLTDGDPTKGLPPVRLTKEQAETIGLFPKPQIVVAEAWEDDRQVPAKEGLYVLYRQSPRSYRRLILAKARKSLRKYRYIKKHYASTEADLAYKVYDLLGSKFDSSVYGRLAYEMDKRISVCEEVLEAFAP